MSIRSSLSFGTVCLLVGLAWSGAEAAPQVLGLVASNGAPTPLVCQGVECSAHFSTFCLQEARNAPSRGQPYAVAPGSSLTLVVTTKDGRTVRLPGENFLKIGTLIGFTSVKIALPEASLRELGGVAARVEVGPLASIVPVAEPNDPDPQAADELALATGPVRKAAFASFEKPGEASDAARVTNLLINALPEDGQDEAIARDRLWERTVDSKMLAGLTPTGAVAAKRIYESCRISIDSRSMSTMRNCLELHHADLMALTNHRFWKELGGS